MTDTELKFLATLRGVANMRKHTLDDMQVNIWLAALSREGVSLERAIEEIFNHVAESQFMPQPSDIIGRVKGTPKTVEAEAMEAWELASRGPGYGPDVVFENPVVHSTINLLGGWEQFCMRETDQLQFIRKDFIRAYAVAKQRTSHPRMLLGYYTAGDPPRLVGDHAKCMAVLNASETGIKQKQIVEIKIKTLDGDK